MRYHNDANAGFLLVDALPRRMNQPQNAHSRSHTDTSIGTIKDCMFYVVHNVAGAL